MISHQTVNPFIIRDSVSWPEFNDDLFVSVLLNDTLDFVERENVIRINEEFELSVKL